MSQQQGQAHYSTLFEKKCEREEFFESGALTDFSVVELLADPKGYAFIIYKKKVPVIFDWVEYEPYSDQMMLMTYDGDMMMLGLSVPEDMQSVMKNCKEILIAYEKDGKIHDYHPVPMIFHDASIN